MRPRLILIGNDVHGSPDEMACRLLRDLAESESEAGRTPLVISLQSRKPLPVPGDPTVLGADVLVVEGRPTSVARGVQLARLVALCWRSLGRGTVLHFVGNGKPALLRALDAVCTLKRSRLIVSPLGEVEIPHLAASATVVRPHSECYTGRHPLPHTIAPWSLLDRGAPRRFGRARLVFASIPPKLEELEERGVPALISEMTAIAARFPESELVILNRHRHLAGALARLASNAPQGKISIVSTYVADTAGLLDETDFVVVPAAHPHLPQVPMTALDGLARGVPILIDRRAALARDVEQHGAGAAFTRPTEIATAMASVVARYEDASRAALELSKIFSRERGREAYRSLYLGGADASRRAGVPPVM